MYDSLNAYLASQGMAVDPTKVVDRAAIVTYLNTAFTANKTYMALVVPTAAQTTEEVKSLAKQCNKLMNLVLNTLSVN